MPEPSPIADQLARMNLTQVQAAHLVGLDPRSFRRYLQAPTAPGFREPPLPVLRLLAVLEHHPAARRWLLDRLD